MQFRDTFEEMVQAELERATGIHAPMPTEHHAYGVMYEELEEWRLEVKAHDRAKAITELVQLAAMVRRCARDVYRLGDAG
jgi:hypothetical protein